METTAKREPEVQGEIASLDKAIERLVNSVSDLETRVVSVLRPADTPPINTEKAVDAVRCPVADMIRSKRQDIDGLTERISALTDRLEN